MKCINCEKPVMKDHAFCASCGHSLLTCNSCGCPFKAGDKFCSQCGEQINRGDEKLLQKSKPERAVATSTTFEGIRKHVTTLFVDIKDSTAIIEGSDPEEASVLLSPIVQEMLSAVYRYNGIVIHTAGDGIVAVFGAPQALEDHALRACLAALSMRKQAQAINNKIKLRIGLNSGEVYLDTFGDEQYQEFDVLGPAVNLAARLEQTASPGSIQISANTLKLVEDYIDYRELPSIELKGFSHKIERYELVAIKETPSLYQIKNTPMDSNFVGREQELEQLQDWLMKIKHPHSGEGISIFSDVGIGKSRLILEFIKLIPREDFACILSGGFSHTNNIPFFPVVNIFRDLMNIHNTDTETQARIKIAPYLENNNNPYALRAIMTILEIMFSDAEWEKLDPGLKQRHIFEASMKILIDYSKKKPLVLIIEDLQWVDEETEKFIDLLLHNIHDASMLLLMSYRSGYQDKWLNTTHYQQIRLEVFNDLEIDDFVNSILGDNHNLIDIKKRLIAGSSGNAFFAREMMKAFIASRIITGEHGNYVLNTNVLISKLELPESIFAVLQMQMDKLSPVQKRILQICSVINEQFDYSLLSQLIEFIDEKELRTALNALLKKQFIYERKIYPEPEFSFKHSLIQEVSYHSLLKTTRRSIHLKIFTILEKTANKHKIEEMQILASHAWLGENWVKAFEYCIKTAEMNFMMSAHNLCVEFYSKALSAAKHLPQNEETYRTIMPIHYELYHVYIRTGQFSQQKKHLDETMRIALILQDKYYESIVNSSISIHYLGNHSSLDAIQYAITGQRLAEEIQSQDALIISQLFLLHCHFFLGNFSELNTLGNTFIENLPNINYLPAAFRAPVGHLAFCFMSWGNSFTGDFEAVKARQVFWFSSMDIETPSIPSMCALGAVGINYFLIGEFEKAIDYLTRALKYATELDIHIFVPIYASRLSLCYLYLNQKVIAKNYLEKAIETVDRIQGVFASVFALNPICQALLLLEEFEMLETRCATAMEVFLQRNLKAEEAQMLRILSEADLANGIYTAQVEERLQNALHLFKTIGMRPEQGHAYLALAKLYHQQQKEEESRKALDKALHSFKEINMESWIQKTEEILLSLES